MAKQKVRIKPKGSFRISSPKKGGAMKAKRGKGSYNRKIAKKVK